MILYDLRCQEGHIFEAWFKDSAAYDKQAEAGRVDCPVCGSTKVEKAPMAPNLARSRKGSESGDVDKAAAVRQALQEVRQQVEENCDYVGERFPEEARRIHYGETDPRGIYGESSAEEAKSLEEEGVKFQRLPWLPRENS